VQETPAGEQWRSVSALCLNHSDVATLQHTITPPIEAATDAGRPIDASKSAWEGGAHANAAGQRRNDALTLQRPLQRGSARTQIVVGGQKFGSEPAAAVWPVHHQVLHQKKRAPEGARSTASVKPTPRIRSCA
jgi:hypothetical protein